MASERDPFVVAWLLAAEKTRTKDTQGWTPLHLAACLGQVGAIQDLIANKADIAAKNKHGWTPLHLAAFLGHPEPVQFLLDHQASTEAIDHKGRTPYDIAGSEVVRQLLGRYMNLGKLIFQCDYDNIGKRILDNLASEDSKHMRTIRRLRETCTEVGWGLLQKGRVVLQVTPNKLLQISPAIYPRLYPHEQSSQNATPTFHPIPADAVVRGVWDWEYIDNANDERLLIKNVVFTGKKVRTLQQLREALPPHLADHLVAPEEILVREKGKETVHEAIPSVDQPVETDNPAPLDEEESSETPYLLNQLNRESSENPYLLNQPNRESSENPYLLDQPAEEPGEEEEPAFEKLTYSSSEETGPADIANQLYDSFVGVKKLAAGKVVVGEYLAKGAFGKVYRGQWGNKAVALKQIDLNHATSKLNITPAEVEGAMQWEVARLSTANHPNLVQFYGLYQDGDEGYTYMVMEFCEGGTLQDKLKKADVSWAQRWRN